MICICCLSDTIELHPLKVNGYSRCQKCNFIFSINSSTEKLSAKITCHYQYQDPHKEVSNSKTSFYNFVLNYLKSQAKTNERKILDIGCGYGYFLNMASQAGWKPFGIEVVTDAVNKCREKIRYENIFQGELKAAGLTEKSFNAVTLWDVIAIVDNPYDELKECYRLLKKGGIIGIRTRNVAFQTSIFQLYGLIKKIALRFGFKEPYVFNKYCFSRKSLYALLSRLGFINIKIINSPLTSGDPYNHMPFHYPVKIAKTCIDICSKLVFSMTRGRWLIAPSLLIWAEKP
ncbi:MAG: class I SAM-dependent methyltransferase [Candidatus Hodarchaeales archaeon]|jgi:SAM-dependent methyltransferase